MAGPLAGVRVVELGGIGPAPFAAMLLADHGAVVVRVDRPGFAPGPLDAMLRSRRMMELDLKTADGRARLDALAADADVLIEGFRPGTAERLGVGPDRLCVSNPRLIYARVTGWGQDGPLATTAGHDINYIALAGALGAIGPAERPVPPLALVGDMGGGGAMLAFAICAALVEAQASGRGQVIDHAMVDGAGAMLAAFHEQQAAGRWRSGREANLLDGGAPFYGVYRTADDRFVAVGALEPAFFAALRKGLGRGDDPAFADQYRRDTWPAMRRRLVETFATRTRDDWAMHFAGSDACVTPVLDLGEARRHPAAIARAAFVEVDGVAQPAPMPRYERTPLAPPRPPRPAADADPFG